MSSVPSIILTDAGWVAPTEDAILAGVLADMNAAFGGNLNLALTTPQGQQAVTTAAIIGGKNAELLALFNGFDPRYASGRQQDALARIYFLERDPARSTVVSVTLTGLSGTVIPTGALAQATDGNVYVNAGTVTIGAGGTVSASFQCQKTGPIACVAGSLNKIYQAIPGWDTITNSTDGAIGQDVESRAAFETRREQSVSINALGILDAIQGKVLAVANVLDAYTTENPSGSPALIGGYTLAPNSLYVAVEGGTDAAVAQAIWSKKAPGCNYNGGTTVTVTDTNGGYSIPYPTYAVSFVRPSNLTVLMAIQVKNSSAVPSDYATQIKNAVINAFSGGDGGPRARIGTTIYSLRYYSPIVALGAWAQIISIQVGAISANAPSMPVNIDQFPVISSGDISVSLV